MAKYKIVNGGVFDTERCVFIPPDSTNQDWVDYQTWLAVPNTPDDDGTKLNELKAEKLDDINNKCNEICSGQITHDAVTYDSTPDRIFAEQLIREVSLSAQDASATPWPVDVFVKAGKLYRLSFANKATLQASVNAAGDEAALDAIDVTAGWPTIPYS